MTLTKKKVDLTEGPIFGKMFLYVLPIMLTGILQLVYNMADHMVVGQFSGDPHALAAVGSTAALTNLIVNLFVGITAGAAVVVARNFGAKDYDTLSKSVHTAMLFALIGGLAFMVIGFAISSPALALMDTKAEILDKATLYMRIICLGIPATAVYNFGATILRSVGDSKTPLYILSTTGIVNVILNCVFVILFNMTVDGVAFATIISQYLSAAAVVFVLYKRKNESYHLDFKKLKLDRRIFVLILKFGIPAAVQTSLFSISNVLLTSATNTFPTEIVSAKTIAGNLDGILYVSLNGYLHASTTFVAQNYGAAKPARIKKSIITAILQVIMVGSVLSTIMLFFGRNLATLFIDSGDTNISVILDGVMEILGTTLPIYFMCGVMESLSGAIRGLGHSFAPMLISVGGICGLRILWIYFFFPLEPLNTLRGLFCCYPLTWSVTALLLGITFIVIWNKMKKTYFGKMT